jgi:hypothetical protein
MSLFHPKTKEVPAAPLPDTASALGIRPPKPTPAHMAGLEAAAAINAQRWDSQVAEYEAARKARLAATKAIEDEVWARVLARQRAAIG